METPDIITTGEAGRIMRCATRTVQRLIEIGELPIVGKMSGSRGLFLLDRAEVERVAKVRAEAERRSAAQTKARRKARAEARSKAERAKAANVPLVGLSVGDGDKRKTA